jgi:hypothetical protein
VSSNGILYSPLSSILDIFCIHRPDIMAVLPKRSLLALLTHIFFFAATQSIPIVGISTTPLPTLPAPKPSLPTLVDGSSGYELLGCYNELASYATERALGVTGSYISPIFASSDALTVPLCLEGCAAAQAPAVPGQYIYAAVENTRYALLSKIIVSSLWVTLVQPRLNSCLS